MEDPANIEAGRNNFRTVLAALGNRVRSAGRTRSARPTSVTVCTTKPDKYDRYLADVFLVGDFSSRSGPGSPPPEESVFLNNALLAAGHAVVKKEWEFSDWGA